VKSNPYLLFIEIKLKHYITNNNKEERIHKKSLIKMNEFRIDDYLMNSDNWIFPQQIDYSTNQTQFIELSNVHHDIPLSNEIHSNTYNLPSSSSMLYDLPLPQTASTTLRLDK
jgi:hypothetical protein